MLSVAELIRGLAGSASPIRYVPAAQDDPQRRCPDIRLARDQLGWEPTVPAEEGLAGTVAFFRGQQTANRAHTAGSV